MSNFKIWIDTPIAGTNVVSPSNFDSDSSRQNGFKAGEPASSSLVNTALRQANLVTTAIMENIGASANDLSVMSSLNDVKNVINDYMLNSTSRTVNFTRASSRSNIVSGETLSNSLGKISKYLADLDDSSVAGCQKANIAVYASADTSKGTIEERLTNLGFKEGSITLEDESYVTLNELKRQGNYVIGNIDFDADKWIFTYDHNSGQNYTATKVFGTIEDEAFRPKEDITFGVATRVYSNINPLSTVMSCASTVRLFCTIKTTGEVIMDCYGTVSMADMLRNFQITIQVYASKINFGYEANPIGPPGTENPGTDNFDPDLGL